MRRSRDDAAARLCEMCLSDCVLRRSIAPQAKKVKKAEGEWSGVEGKGMVLIE